MGRTIIRGRFEWDEDKALLNFKKHGIAFEDVLAIFDDPRFFEIRDGEHSSADEERFLGYGRMRNVVVAAAVYTERERTRIISARRATKKEEASYYGRTNRND